ncbi:5-formyltetrahydrofolate cyclo-ligase [Sphingomonas sp.]|uniref:5-formyltetrahydrofolate cyclo-ligase n=1 Tax=Sphingomonas sp. TaxID=28214 RepID=UPI0035AE441F
MKTWDEIRAWRRAKRAELRSLRLSLPRDERERVRAIVTALIRQQVPDLGISCIGFCWPFKGEVDLRHVVRDALRNGAEAALPVVVEKARPLEFWSWQPHMPMQRGIWNIPIPAERRVVHPTILLVPLLGFDACGYRLGYGGGYFDRTLAIAAPRPMTIGVGYELGRLPTIHPQPHDIPLDAIVTERGFTWIDHGGAVEIDRATTEDAGDGGCFASPACSMHELDPARLGYLGRMELLGLLGELLEGERAGARSVGRMSVESGATEIAATLRDVARDEARFCAMLTNHIRRLGGEPSLATSAFYDKVMALDQPHMRIDLLNRGQGWVVRKLRETLLRIDDLALRMDLQVMLAVHERNINRCTQLLELSAPPPRQAVS